MAKILNTTVAAENQTYAGLNQGCRHSFWCNKPLLLCVMYMLHAEVQLHLQCRHCAQLS